MKNTPRFGAFSLPANPTPTKPLREHSFRDRPADKSVQVHSFVRRHLADGEDNYTIALLLERAGYTFRDLSDALIAVYAVVVTTGKNT